MAVGGVLRYTLEVDTKKGVLSVKNAAGEFVQLGDKAEASGRKGSTGMKGLFSSVTDINQALELAKKAWHVLSRPIGDIIKTASDAREISNQFLVVFKNEAPAAQKYIDDLSSAIGRNRTEIKGAMSSFQDTFVPLGFARDRARELSQTLVTLGYDLGSFKNIPIADVFRDMQSAIVGNHETVRKYGIILSETTLNQELLNMGVAGGCRKADELSKIQARVNVILGATTDAQGDAVRTAHEWANSVRSLNSLWTEFKEIAGDAIIDALKPYLAQLKTWILENKDAIEAFAKKAGEAIAKFLETLVKVGKFLYSMRDTIILVGKVWAVSFALNKIAPFFLAMKTGLGVIKDNYRKLRDVGVSSMSALSNSMKEAGFSATTLAAKINKIPRHVKITIAVATFAAGWEAGKYLDKEYNISAWLQQQDDKIRKTLDQYTQVAEKRMQINQTNKDFLQGIKDIGAALGEESGSLRAIVKAIAENETAYKNLSAEQKKFVDGMINAINQAPTLEYHLQKLTGEMGLGAMTFRDRMQAVLNDYKSFSKLPENFQKQLVETAKKFEDLGKIGGDAIEYIRNKLFSINPALARSAKDFLNFSGNVLKTFKLFSGSQVDVTKKAKDLIDEYEKQKRTIKGNKEETQKYLEKLKGLKNLSPEVQAQIEKITAELTGKAGAVKQVNKELDKYREKLGLIKLSDLERETILLTTALKGNEDQFINNIEIQKKVKKEVDELIAGYKTFGRDAPPEIKRIQTQIELAKGAQVDWDKEIKNTIDEIGEITPKIVKFGVETDLTAQSIAVVGDFTRKWWEYCLDLAPTLSGLSRIIGQATGVLQQFGIIGEKTAQVLNSIGSGLGEISGGLDLLGKKDATIFDKISGGISVFSGAASIAVSVISSIIDLFSGDGIQEAIDRENAWMNLNDQLNESIHKLAEEIGSVHAATSEYLNEIMSTSLDASNFDQFADRLREIQADVIQGTLTQAEANAAMGESFTVLLEKAREFGKEGTYYMLQIIRQNRDMGLNVAEINDYLLEKLSEGIQGLTQYLNTMQGTFAENIDFAEANLLRLFGAYQEEGYGFLEIVKMMGDSLTTFAEKAAAEGLQVSGAIQEMIDLQAFISQNESLIQNIDATSQIMRSLGDSAYLTQDLFTSFGLEAQKQFQALIAAGANEKDALRLLGPEIQQLIKYHESYGYAIDAETKALIEKAQKEGVINAQSYSEGEKQRMLLEEIVRLLGGDIPYEIEQLTGKVSDSVGRMQRDTTAWQDSLENVGQQMGTLENAISNLDKVYTDKMTGHSIVNETEKWKSTLESVDQTLFQIGGTVTLFDREYVNITRKIEDETRQTWLKSLDEIKKQIGIEIPSELQTLQGEYDHIMSLMSDSTQQLYLGADGVVRTLKEILRLEGQVKAGSSGFGSKYGVYTDEEKQKMTADFYAMKQLFDENRSIILTNKDQMASFYRDFSSLVVIDDIKDQFNYWLKSYSQWNTHVQKGHTWNESTKSWMEPDIKAARGFQTWLDKPTHFLMGNTHILAGESGPELLTITPQERLERRPYIIPSPSSNQQIYPVRRDTESEERGGDIYAYFTINNYSDTDVAAEVVRAIRTNKHGLKTEIRSLK